MDVKGGRNIELEREEGKEERKGGKGREDKID